MSTASTSAEQRVVLDNIQWSTYLAILNDVDNRHGRITYDQELLEIMSPSKLHEKIKTLIGRMVEVFTEELRIEIESVGSTTFKREDIKRGFEGDEGYYIQNTSAVRGKDEIDLAIDPPPDLVVEVDISRTSLAKLTIYTAMSIPEVWRFEGDQLCIYVLRGDHYEVVSSSRVLPDFPFPQVARLLDERNTTGETELIRRFRARLTQRG